MKKNNIVSWILVILGILTIGYGVLAYFVKEGFFSFNDKLGNAIIALGLISFAFIVVLPKIKKKVNSLSTSLRMAEFVILLLAAFIGFILPIFSKDATKGNGSLWFGIALSLDGAITLYLLTISTPKHKNIRFFAGLAFVIFGTLIYARGYVNQYLDIVTLVVLAIAGLVLLYYGFSGIKEAEKSTK